MSGKKHRKLRKELGVTKENLRQKDLTEINPKEKVVYFKNIFGDLVPQKTTRSQVVNRNLHYYRQQKKKLNRGE
jgi:hypothetical protein